ncbi:MAG TPA: DUF4843 domain-containing protein [Chitinophagaceae bacterium]
MKKIIQYIILAVAVIAIASCEEDVPTLFNESDGIYFSAKEDSLFYSFAKYPNRLTDTVKLSVTVLGQAAGVDRTITVEKGTGVDINGTENIHYKLLPPYKLPAGQVSTTIPVVVFRTGDLDSLKINFRLQLKENEHFKSGISSKTSMKVSVAFLQKPPSWGEIGGIQWAGFSANFGTWTKTKYKVILDALYDPVSDSTVSEFNFSRFGPPAISLQYMTMVKNYLRTNYPGNFSVPVGIGPTLRDPDANNNVVLVGPANY